MSRKASERECVGRRLYWLVDAVVLKVCPGRSVAGHVKITE